MLVVGLLIGALGSAALAASDTQFYACLNNFTGALLRVNTHAAPQCGWGESSVSWGQQGAKGAQGEKGDKGDKGDQGPKGDAGANGKDGAAGKDGKDGVAGKDGAPGQDGNNGATRIVSRSASVPNDGNEKSLSIPCPIGYSLVGGGYGTEGEPDAHFDITYNAAITIPTLNWTVWTVDAQNTGAAEGRMTVYALCTEP